MCLEQDWLVAGLCCGVSVVVSGHSFMFTLGTDHYLLSGVKIFGTCRQFFPKSNAFQTIFFITFCNENNFLQPFLKTLQAFL